MMESKTQLTIFTPTYNRIDILPSLYSSLCSQSCKDFVWLVIDDGSEDETGLLVRKWEEEKKIAIVYIYQKNSGKHAAHNTAVNNCTTAWMMCVDSDDRLTQDAVEVVNRLIEEEKSNDSTIGLVGQRGDLSGNILYKKWPKEKYVRFYDLYDKIGFKGETVLAFRTDILRQYPFPVFNDEKYMPENVVYRRINDAGFFRTIDKVIYCFEYRSDGYTNNTLKMILNNPKGYLLSLKAIADKSDSMIDRAKAYAYYRAIEKNIEASTEFYLKDDEMPSMVRIAGMILEPRYILKIKKAIRENS